MVALAIKNLFSSCPSNEWLMEQYASTQDSQYLAQLYDQCADDVYHFLLTMADPPLAADMAQRSWLKVIEKRHMYHASGQFKSWLFTLARRTLIDELRKLDRWTELEKPDNVPAQEQISLSGQNVDERFNQALQQLPFAQREAFCLQQEGFGLQQISGITQCPVESVKSRLRYAKQSLRQQLNEFKGYQHG